MMELWGSDQCETCFDAKMFMSRTPLEWKYVDVSIMQFEGQIPRLVFENGADDIIGFPAIKEYVRKLLKELGFPEGMV